MLCLSRHLKNLEIKAHLVGRRSSLPGFLLGRLITQVLPGAADSFIPQAQEAGRTSFRPVRWALFFARLPSAFCRCTRLYTPKARCTPPVFFRRACRSRQKARTQNPWCLRFSFPRQRSPLPLRRGSSFTKEISSVAFFRRGLYRCQGGAKKLMASSNVGRRRKSRGSYRGLFGSGSSHRTCCRPK